MVESEDKKKTTERDTECDKMGNVDRKKNIYIFLRVFESQSPEQWQQKN